QPDANERQTEQREGDRHAEGDAGEQAGERQEADAQRRQANTAIDVEEEEDRGGERQRRDAVVDERTRPPAPAEAEERRRLAAEYADRLGQGDGAAHDDAEGKRPHRDRVGADRTYELVGGIGFGKVMPEPQQALGENDRADQVA